MSRREKQINRRQFGWSAAEALRWKCGPQRKLGEICRLARLHRGLAGIDVATATHHTTGHIYNLEAGKSRSFDSYQPLTAVLDLDGTALLRLLLEDTEVPPPDTVAVLLLGPPDAAADSTSTTQRSANPQLQSVYVEQVSTVLLKGWSPAHKLGEVCRLTRHRKKWTLKAVAMRLGVSSITLSMLEAGNMPFDNYPPLLSVLGLDPTKWAPLVNVPLQTEELAELLRAAIAPEPTGPRLSYLKSATQTANPVVTDIGATSSSQSQEGSRSE